MRARNTAPAARWCIAVALTVPGLEAVRAQTPTACSVRNEFDLTCASQGGAGTPYVPGANCRTITVDGFPRRYVAYLSTNPKFAGSARGYTTQFVLFNASGSGASIGTVRFFTQSGQPLELVLK
jgi:hypothetical protein